MAEIKKNIYLFYGEDDFSLRQKIQLWKTEFAKKYSASSVVTISGEGLAEPDLSRKLEEVLAPSLFSSKKLVIARNVLPAKAAQTTLIQALEKLIESIPADYFFVFWQDSLDRRLGFIKNLVKEIHVQEFNLPHGRELDAWITRQAAKLGASIEPNAADKLGSLVGRDLFEEKKIGGRVVERREMFDLWQVYSELTKLAANTKQITAKEVAELVVPFVPENVFALSDELIRQNKKGALEVLETLMNDQNQDEKSIAIKLIGLIAEQVRSLLVVNLLKRQNMDQNQIAESLGWSSGRVFVMLKHSTGVSLDKLKKLLSGLLAADNAIKSQDINPKLLIDLIIAS